jgi:MOSC domain-containing protein YiiM
MKVLSINTASPDALLVGTKLVTTGIFKTPQPGSVYLGELGLEGDTIVNKKVHGGTDQAVYLYSSADYAWWSEQLGREIEPGMFGENLTITDFHPRTLRVGDRLLIDGKVLLEITAPRVPCAQFAAKMGDSAFGKKFVAAKRSGAYARVLTPGEIKSGSDIEWQPTNEDYASIEEIFVEWHKKSWDPEIAKKVLSSPVSKIARGIIEERTGLKT